MRKNVWLIFLAALALILQSGLAAAVSPPLLLRWDGSDARQPTKLFIRNLGTGGADASLERVPAQRGDSEPLFVAAGQSIEVPAGPFDKALRLRVRGDAPLFVLQVPEGFDTGATEVEGSSSLQLDRAGGRLRATVNRPEWAASLISLGATLATGRTGQSHVAAEVAGTEVEVAVAFLAPRSSVRIRLLDAKGAEITVAVASASGPLRWRTRLGDLPEGGARVEVKALQGSARWITTAVEPGGRRVVEMAPPLLAKTGGGTGYFSTTISWYYSGDLYYSVAGAPASTCGTLWTYRNSGPWTSTPGWICTDASGNATKGPWTWAGQSGDETAYGYIEWPGSLYTNVAEHIWDKSCTTTTITSPGGSPPTSLYGAATDVTWGAGFDASWSTCTAYFYDRGTGYYWTPAAGAYSTTSNVGVSCSISGMPGMTVTWSESSIPPGGAHAGGHCYDWYVCVPDGYCGYCDIYTFCT